MLRKTRNASSCYPIVAAVAAAILLCISQPGIAQSAPSLEGTWEVAVTTSSGRVISSLITFFKGGGMILTENGGAPAAFNAAQGTWVKIGDHEFAFRWKRFHFAPVSGDFLFTLQVWGDVELQPGFQEYVGSGVSEVILPDGTVLPGSTTTTHGTRLLVE